MQSRYNHRGHQAAGDVKPDAVVRSEAELIACPRRSAQRSERNMQKEAQIIKVMAAPEAGW